jgi:hypothetical protein
MSNKLLPGVYVHLVSGRLAVVYEVPGGESHLYSDKVVPRDKSEAIPDDEHDSSTPGFPVDFGNLYDQPEIWEWIGEL